MAILPALGFAPELLAMVGRTDQGATSAHAHSAAVTRDALPATRTDAATGEVVQFQSTGKTGQERQC